MQLSKEYKPDDASLLANNMAGLTHQLNLVYRQFQTRAFSEEGLRFQILKILNGNYPETLVEPIIKELELRCQLRDEISGILTYDGIKVLKSNQLILDKNYRIDVTETLRQFYLSQLATNKPDIKHSNCAIFGFTEFISEHYEIFQNTFFGEQNRNQILITMFYLSAVHGNLAFLQKLWELAESLGIEKDMITNNNFSAVSGGRASNNLQINEFIMTCASKTNFTTIIPEFTADDMFPQYARSNNHIALLSCWKQARRPEAYLLLLTNNNCKVFDTTEGDGQEKTREILLNCLISLSKTGVITIPHDIWRSYFLIAAKKGSLALVEKIWLALEDEALKKSLLDHVILDVCDDHHIPIMKFIIEQAESLVENPIQRWKFDLIEETIPNGLKRIGELFSNSPLIRALHSPIT